MIELSLPFIISQIAVSVAMIFDFLSLQFKERKKTFLCLIISATLISFHYFLLNKTAAGVIVFFSILRFITCYFTTNKKFLVLFLILNTLSLFFTYNEVYDLIIYLALVIIIIGNFQENNKTMRKVMMLGTALAVLYNTIILSPMGAVVESSFLISNIIGYYRHFIKNKKKDDFIVE
jgi:hypothetical protein